MTRSAVLEIGCKHIPTLESDVHGIVISVRRALVACGFYRVLTNPGVFGGANPVFKNEFWRYSSFPTKISALLPFK
jgi:hypothetical protein